MSVVRTLIGNVKGPKGDTGSQGPQGVAGTIEIGSVQTVSYGSPASVTNSGTEEEAILDFQIPQGAPGAQVTDMSNLVLSTITDSTADYPAFAVSETGSTIFGKIRKFLYDLKNKYVSKSMMTTSTDVDTAGQAVADAKAIKSLNDSLSNTLANWDTVSVYSGTANIVAPYTDYATASCTLDAGTYIVQAYLEVTGAVSNIGYFAKFESTSEILATSTFDRPSGYSPSVSMACPVRITSQTNFTLRCGVNYLGGGTSAGTASGKLRVLKLK